jgi:hypothetical protein
MLLNYSDLLLKPLLRWGNIPAINLLNLEKNEGLSCKCDLSLAFAGETFIVLEFQRLLLFIS